MFRAVLGNVFFGERRRGGIAIRQQFFGGRRFCYFLAVTALAEAVKPNMAVFVSAVM